MLNMHRASRFVARSPRLRLSRLAAWAPISFETIIEHNSDFKIHRERGRVLRETRGETWR